MYKNARNGKIKKKNKNTGSSIYRKLGLVNRHGIFSSSLVSLLKFFPHFISLVAFRPLFFAQCTLRWLLRSGVQFLYISLSVLLFFVLSYWCHIRDSMLQIWISHEVVTVTSLQIWISHEVLTVASLQIWISHEVVTVTSLQIWISHEVVTVTLLQI
jgi:hypothetical protein